MKFKSVLLTVSIIFVGNVSIANPADTMISSMREDVRREFLSEFLQSSGEACKVTRTFRQGETSNGDVFWNVGCRDGSPLVILMHNNASGTTRILECSVIRAVAGTNCFEPF